MVRREVGIPLPPPNWMAEHHFTVDEIGYAVAKPWKHRDWIRRAQTSCGDDADSG